MIEGTESELRIDEAASTMGARVSVTDVTRLSRVHMAALAALWTVLALIAGPRGDFPLNDDWAYGLPVQSLVDHGALRLTFWQSMPLLPQFAWGALFALPFGFSFTALRVSTLVLGMVGVLGTYALLRRRGVPPLYCLAGALCLAVNPMYVTLAHSFMSDVPFTVALVVSAVFLLRALERNELRPLLAGVALAIVATLIRQIGVVLPLAFVIAAALSWDLRGRRFWLHAVLPLVLVAAVLPASRALLESTVGLPRLYDFRDVGLSEALRDLAHARLGALRLPIERSVLFVLYTGLFLSPITLTLLVAEAPGKLRLLLVGLASALLAAALVVLRRHMPVPVIGNVMLELAVGPRTLTGVALELPVALPRIAITLLASSGAVAMLYLLGARVRPAIEALRRRKVDPSAVFAIVVIIVGFGPFAIAYGTFFDRYMLFALPLLLLLLLGGRRLPSLVGRACALTLAPAFVLGVGGALFSTAAVHDYLGWNRARWQAAAALSGRGIALDQIDAGFEYNNYVANIGLLTGGPGQSNVVDRENAKYAVQFAPLEAGQIELARVSTESWLPYAPTEVLAVERTTAPVTK
jgi:4-amino-4-deoxy-L-arabinose transferase-like glycosyltransferase